MAKCVQTVLASAKLHISMRNVLMVLLLFQSIATGYAKEKTYLVVDSGVWSSNMWPPTVYWLDNNRVLFPGSEDLTYKSSRFPMISIWEIGKGVTHYKRDATIRCFRSGTLWYLQKIGPSQFVNMRGPLGQEAPYEKPASKSVTPDYKLRCAYVDRQSIQQRGRLSRPLLEEHGYLDLGSSTTDQSGQNQTVSLFGLGSAAGKPMPFKSNQIGEVGFFKFKKSYFIRSEYFDNLRKTNVFPWPMKEAQPLWWLTPLGEVTEIKIPPLRVWNKGGSVIVVPTAKGILFLYHGGFKSESDPADQGMYLYSNGSVELIMQGFAEGPSVSADGCKVAFAHAPNLRGNLASDANRRTLKMIDFCS